jgi:CRISPR/Cas system-associated exonuclease Cas4 (RecB family)
VALPDHTSATQLTTYARCPRKYRYRYLEDAEPEFRAVGLALGSVVHGAAEWWFNAKLAGQKPTVEEAMDIVRADFAAATHDGLRWGQWTYGDLEAKAQRLVRTFLEHVGDTEVVATEQRFEIALYDPETGESLPRPLIGYFDQVLGPGRVMELKTSRSDYKPLDLTVSLQLAAYLSALGQEGSHGELELVVLIKNRVPRVQRLKLHPNARTERWFLRAATDIERAIQAGLFPPAPGYGCASCEYQNRCLGAAVQTGRRAA